MHVLVLGGNRFVGRYLVWRLLAGGHTVTTFNRGRLADPFEDRIERLTGDRSTGDWERLLDGRRFDAVVDLAMYTGDEARRAVALLGGRVGHYVMVSTGQVYLVREGMARPMSAPASEGAYDGPVMARPDAPSELEEWIYGTGKRAAEDVLAQASNLPCTRLRIPMVNGPGDYLRRLEGYLWRLADGGPVIVPDGGTHLVRHVDASEVARFIADILLDERTFGRAFNLAQEETPPLIELLGQLKAMVGSASVLTELPAAALGELKVEHVSPFSGRWMSFLDPSRARDELGFVHAPLAQTLRAVVSAFLAHTPQTTPPGYLRRSQELALVRRWRGTASS